MKVRELIKELESNKGRFLDKDILIACDEEWNILFKDIELEQDELGRMVLFGLSGSEVEND